MKCFSVLSGIGPHWAEQNLFQANTALFKYSGTDPTCGLKVNLSSQVESSSWAIIRVQNGPWTRYGLDTQCITLGLYDNKRLSPSQFELDLRWVYWPVIRHKAHFWQKKNPKLICNGGLKSVAPHQAFGAPGPESITNCSKTGHIKKLQVGSLGDWVIRAPFTALRKHVSLNFDS